MMDWEEAECDWERYTTAVYIFIFIFVLVPKSLHYLLVMEILSYEKYMLFTDKVYLSNVQQHSSDTSYTLL